MNLTVVESSNIWSIVVVPAVEWKDVSKEAHLLSFGKNKEAEEDRFDFVLMGVRDKTPLGFITCREVSSKILYWQWGGVFPLARKSIHVYSLYDAASKLCLETYECIITYIENTNDAMLRLAAKIGFIITGTRFINGQLLVEQTLYADRTKTTG